MCLSGCVLGTRRLVGVLVSLTLLFPSCAGAWNEKTHIAIAYVAYHRLSRHAKDRVDEVLVLHPLYSQWTKGVKATQAGLMAFVHAATWADDIQNSAKFQGYVADGTDNGMVPSIGQEEWQNIGYSDMLMHKYWHFIQLPYAAAAETTASAPRPNIETQLQILIEAINSNEEDPLKSFDVVWIENLIGELHQPLNCISRFSSQHPNGDQNGREVKLREGELGANLHAYWDNILGAEQDFDSAIREGKALNGIQNENGFWDELDIDKLVNESYELAKKSVYTEAVIAGDNSGAPFVLDAAYREAAVKVATHQAFLAGNRLASVLNNNLR